MGGNQGIAISISVMKGFVEKALSRQKKTAPEGVL